MAPVVRMNVQAVAKPSLKAAPKAAVVPKGLGQAALLSVAALVQAAPARADEVDSAVDSIVGAIKATGEFVKAGVTTAQAGVEVLKQGYDAAAPVVAKGIEAATPVVSEAFKATSNAVTPLLKDVNLPSLSDAARTLETSGLPTKAISQTTSEALTAATPAATKFLQFLATADPVTLGEYALASVAAVYIVPALLGGVVGSFKGYAGELTAASALDTVVNEGNALLVDIRTVKEKESSGIPDVPSSGSGKVVEVEFAVVEDRKLRGSIRDAGFIEAQVTALQIASLKRVNKSTKIILLDRYGNSAATVAKELAKKGYGRVYLVAGGFDGRGGWVNSKLQIKPAATILSAPAPSIATKTVSVFGKRALPAPKSA